MVETRSATMLVRMKPSMIAFIDEYRDAHRDKDGDRPSRSEVVRLALSDFLGRELAKIRTGRK
jgi:Arc/MetJ-type ribon-helix-helix transcriptional regulator